MLKQKRRLWRCPFLIIILIRCTVPVKQIFSYSFFSCKERIENSSTTDAAY